MPQMRRDAEPQQRLMFVTWERPFDRRHRRAPMRLLIKYIDVGGRHCDEAVARRLKLSLGDAASLRRHNADRRTEDRDPEIVRGVGDAVRRCSIACRNNWRCVCVITT